MGNSHKGETSRLIVSGGLHAADFSKLSAITALRRFPLSGEARHA